MRYRLQAGVAALIMLIGVAPEALSGPANEAAAAEPPAIEIQPAVVGVEPPPAAELATASTEPNRQTPPATNPAKPTPVAERLLSSAQPSTSEAQPAARFGWPLSPAPSVSRSFQPPNQPYGPGHRGADLVGSPGQPVLAAGDGVVVYAGPLAGRGVVSVQHANGLRTSYEPVLVSVRAGQLVKRGAMLGTLAPGHRGCPAPACLHWGLRQDGQYLDPLLLVRRGPVRLLPWTEADDESG